MHEQLTESDVKKIQEEIEYRKLVLMATSVKILSIMLQKKIRTVMKAGFVILREC